jgi:hypothetical protein
LPIAKGEEFLELGDDYVIQTGDAAEYEEQCEDEQTQVGGINPLADVVIAGKGIRGRRIGGIDVHS